MSILIKGMEMPTSCRACHLKMNCDDCEGRECVCVPLHQKIGYLDDLLVDKCRDDCPLIEVPPHGDLIDRDALPMGRVEWEDIVNAPIIIEADTCNNSTETRNKSSDDEVNASLVD